MTLKKKVSSSGQMIPTLPMQTGGGMNLVIRVQTESTVSRCFQMEGGMICLVGPGRKVCA